MPSQPRTLFPQQMAPQQMASQQMASQQMAPQPISSRRIISPRPMSSRRKWALSKVRRQFTFAFLIGFCGTVLWGCGLFFWAAPGGFFK
jgi:hypothetical protein